MRTWMTWMLALAMPVALAGKVYIYKDANGKTVYSDLPPPQGQKSEIKNLGGNVIDTSGLPYDIQMLLRRNPITLWGTDCGELCTGGMQVLQQRNLPFTVKNPGESPETMEAFKKATGGNMIPTLQVGNRTIRGFSVDSWNAALDAAGFPKSLPKVYRPANKPAEPAPATKP